MRMKKAGEVIIVPSDISSPVDEYRVKHGFA